MGQGLIHDHPVPGWTCLRVLSERERSTVFLARDAAGASGCLKLTRFANSEALAEQLRRTERLQPLSRQPGLVPILEFGATVDGRLWKRMPLADNLPGLPGLTDQDGVEQYTPLTLRARTQELGPAPAPAVADWGQRLAGALTVLHDANLIHRDVKPGNIFFIDGEPCLGDYGLVSEPGPGREFRGTEGYRPAEGTNGPGGDLFALGKTLYEAWTGCDRLEYPSLTRAMLDSPDWPAHGSQLNEVILKACHNNPDRRFRSAAALSAALNRAVSGDRPFPRRRWLAAATGLLLIGVSVSGYLLWPAARPSLINVDFGAGRVTQKTGPAALGQGVNDFWNFYTRDHVHGGVKTFDHLPDLKTADGTPTGAALTIVNAPGAWPIGSPDPMYNHVVYSLDGRSVLVTVTNLPAGRYDVLLYSRDGNFGLKAGAVSYGVRRCRDTNDVQQLVWQEGVHYVRFSKVVIAPCETLVMTVRTGLTGYAKICGLQLLGPLPRGRTGRAT